MKERPILFNCAMVRAILEGRKTQTRRVVKHIPDLGYYEDWCSKTEDADFKHIVGDYRRYCPYGQPGERLWVRETFKLHDQGEDSLIIYGTGERRTVGPLSGDIPDNDLGCYFCLHDKAQKAGKTITVPSIHMPRWASSITLEITSVRVERLQDISKESTIAEGIYFVDHGKDTYGQQNNGYNVKSKAILGPDHCLGTARYGFANLWESINGHGSWDKNPWVWVVEFRRIKT